MAGVFKIMQATYNQTAHIDETLAIRCYLSVMAVLIKLDRSANMCPRTLFRRSVILYDTLQRHFGLTAKQLHE